ncbi:MAG: hypothetical protein P8Z49_02290 [Acidobacteriota bacterium]
MSADGSAKTFPCPNCGGELAWDPARQEMHCPYCDSLIPVPSDPGFAPEEQDLMAFLKDHPRSTGYGVTLKQFTCRQCGASVQIPPRERSVVCPFCGSDYVLESGAAQANVLKPESLLPFSVDDKACRTAFKKWIGSGWFHPRDLKKMGKLERIMGLYLPFFTFDAHADSTWTAMAGHAYYVSESFTGRDSNGNAVQRSRQVRRIRWEPASGSRSDNYNDVLVPAVHEDRLDMILKVYPYDLVKLTAYDPRYLAGFGVLNADIPVKLVYHIASNNMAQDQRRLCAESVPGDTYRDLAVNTRFSKQTFKHLLCPVWAGAFRYRKRSYPFVLNGQTGKLYGRKPLSTVKVTLAALVGAALALFLLWLMMRS